MNAPDFESDHTIEQTRGLQLGFISRILPTQAENMGFCGGGVRNIRGVNLE